MTFWRRAALLKMLHGPNFSAASLLEPRLDPRLPEVLTDNHFSLLTCRGPRCCQFWQSLSPTPVTSPWRSFVVFGPSTSRWAKDSASFLSVFSRDLLGHLVHSFSLPTEPLAGTVVFVMWRSQTYGWGKFSWPRVDSLKLMVAILSFLNWTLTYSKTDFLMGFLWRSSVQSLRCCVIQKHFTLATLSTAICKSNELAVAEPKNITCSNN